MRSIITILIVSGLYLLSYHIITRFIPIHTDSFIYGILTGVIVLTITGWITKRFDRAEELEEKYEKKEDETSKDNPGTLS